MAEGDASEWVVGRAVRGIRQSIASSRDLVQDDSALVQSGSVYTVRVQTGLSSSGVG